MKDETKEQIIVFLSAAGIIISVAVLALVVILYVEN